MNRGGGGRERSRIPWNVATKHDWSLCLKNSCVFWLIQESANGKSLLAILFSAILPAPLNRVFLFQHGILHGKYSAKWHLR